MVGELRDEGDEGAGRQVRGKKKLRKKEERREAGERERKKMICLFSERMREKCNKKKYIYIYLLLSYSAHLKIDVHYKGVILAPLLHRDFL